MRNICVIGVGYVGLVTGACLADLGNHVICLNRNQTKADNLKKGIMPIYEPGLEEIVRRNHASGRLDFTTSYDEALQGVDFVFIAVGTPSGAEGEADLIHVNQAAEGIAERLNRHLIIVNKSTVPIGTGDWVDDIVRENMPNKEIEFSVVSNPEFLREGSAVYDFMNPDRIVLGSTNPAAAHRIAELYYPLQAPIIITDLRTAEMIKYASNAFLATKISFINEIANICEALGADVTEVARGMGMDQRIGPQFLGAGVGWGGSCFPKDVKALAHMAATHGAHPQLLRAVMEINYDQRKRVIQKLRDILGGFGEDGGHPGPGLQTEHRRHARRALHRDYPHAPARGGADQDLRSPGHGDGQAGTDQRDLLRESVRCGRGCGRSDPGDGVERVQAVGHDAHQGDDASADHPG